MSFFERYFAALDGPEPLSSLELVAEDVHFCILWSADGKTTEVTGGREDLRRFIEAGDDWRDWRHHILWSARDGDTEFAAGETRYDDGRRIGTYMVFAQLDAAGRMVRYMAARTPVTQFSSLGIESGSPS
jgi:hypothetical protein